MANNVKYPVARLLPGRQQRLLDGHPWVFGNDVSKVDGRFEPGAIVDVVDSRGSFVGRGYINPRSQILIRLMTWRQEPVDAGLIARRVQAAWRKRGITLDDTSSCRVVFGEADFLPGLIVDKFEDTLVIQELALGIDTRQEMVVNALVDTLKPRGIYARNDAPVRQLEGLEQTSGVVYGDVPDQLEISENNLKVMVDVAGGQKTGYFLDQRLNRLATRRYSRDARVLDCFSNVGGFALNAVAGGAQEVIAVDSSADALAGVNANAALNNMAERITTQEANVFDLLKQFDQEKQRFDLIVLDPPAFAKNRAAVEGATRGYKEINLRAMRMLNDGGFLITCSCSFHMTQDLFMGAVFDAGLDARRRLTLVENRAQAPDHPILLGYPESHYLKCLILQVNQIG